MILGLRILRSARMRDINLKIGTDQLYAYRRQFIRQCRQKIIALPKTNEFPFKSRTNRNRAYRMV